MISKMHLAGLLVAVTVGIGVLVTAFVWPTVNTAPRNVPIAIAPATAASQVAAALDGEAPPGAIAIHPVADRSAAEAAIRSREVYGAIVVDPSGPVVLKASAASPVIGQLLDQVAAVLTAQAQGVRPGTAVDVVASPSGDPRGAGLSIATIPLTIAGLVLGALLGLAARRPAARIGALAAGAMAVGLLIGGLLHAFGALDGGYLSEAAVIALIVGAIAAVTLGAVSRLGRAGIAPVAVVMILFGVPLSGAMSAPQMLPRFWGAFGQWLPPGAGATGLRSVSFFPEASVAGPLWILVGWLLVGLALVTLPNPRAATAVPIDVSATPAATPW